MPTKTKLSKISPQITVANSYLMSFIDYCESQFETRIDHLIDFVDIDRLRTLDPEHRVDANLYNRLFNEVARHFEYPTLGLEFGAQIGAKAFNLLGYLTMSSRTLGEAARGLQKYNRLVSNMGESNIHFNHKVGFAEWKSGNEIPSLSYHVIDAVLAGWFCFSRQIVEKDVPLLKVELKHNNHQYRQTYEQVFGCPIEFSASKNQLLFEKHWFDLPVAQSQRAVYQAIIAQADLAMAKMETGAFPTSDYIVDVIQECLPAGEFGVSAIASKFGVSERTFQRKLSQQGVTFRELLERARRKLAVKLLKADELPHVTIAGLIGFAEQSAFIRAFKRWEGVTPKQYLKRSRS